LGYVKRPDLSPIITKHLSNPTVRILKRNEELDLVALAKSGDKEAVSALVDANIKYAVKLSKRYANRHVPAEELLQQALIGICRAITRFDPDRGVRFLGYAKYWMKAEIKEFILRSRSQVRMGTTQKQRKVFSGLGRARAKVEYKNLDLTGDERLSLIAVELGVDEKVVREMDMRLSGQDLSLHNKASDDSEVMFIDLLEDEDTPSPEDSVDSTRENEHQRALAELALGVLSERERFIIEHRYLEQKVSLRVLGKSLGISRERIRQLEIRAKDKMKQALVDLGANSLDELDDIQDVDRRPLENNGSAPVFWEISVSLAQAATLLHVADAEYGVSGIRDQLGQAFYQKLVACGLLFSDKIDKEEKTILVTGAAQFCRFSYCNGGGQAIIELDDQVAPPGQWFSDLHTIVNQETEL